MGRDSWTTMAFERVTTSIVRQDRSTGNAGSIGVATPTGAHRAG